MSRFPGMRTTGARMPIGGRKGPTSLTGMAALAGLALCLLFGCQATEPEEGSYLNFRNPELTLGLDSLFIFGINAAKGDTLPIRIWRKDEAFPPEAPYPPGLEG